MRISPTEWFTESSMVLLIPQWSGMNLATKATQDLMSFLMFNPLTFGQSLAITWVYIIDVIAATVVCFGVTYILFVRKRMTA